MDNLQKILPLIYFKLKKHPNKITQKDEDFIFSTFQKIEHFDGIISQKKKSGMNVEEIKKFFVRLFGNMTLETFQKAEPIITYGKPSSITSRRIQKPEVLRANFWRSVSLHQTPRKRRSRTSETDPPASRGKAQEKAARVQTEGRRAQAFRLRLRQRKKPLFLPRLASQG